jgi:hypothetical protein
MFGIDQQVQQTADAYRGKPQMLQQKYAQNQQLIDLLALQKLKSDKEEASRQMALSMGSQGKPPTIADQRESQVLDMTKKEVIDEQAGVMQNKMKQMQDAQKRVLQSAGAPPMPGQSSPQPQQPPSAGLAGLPAPNIQGMAGGGIVAFDQGGSTGEEEARRAMEQRRQQPAAQPQQQAAPRGGMQAGLNSLLAIRPEDVYERRREAAARDVNYTPEERAAKERQIQERSASDKEAEFINALLGMSGRSTNAGAIAAGGAAAQNTRNQALAARQRAEGELIDIGPASRAAGLKAGESAYGHAMPGLISGVKAGVDMAQTAEQGANRAQTARDAAELRAQVAREAESGRSESRATARHKVIIDYVKENQALKLLEMKAINGTAADKAAANALFTQLYRQTEAMIGNAGNPSATPPAATPAPNVVPYNSLPK